LCVNHDRIHNVEGFFNIVQCNHCGLIYVNPRPTSECIASYYPSNYGPYQPVLGKEVRINRNNFIKLSLKRFFHLVCLSWLVYRMEVKNIILPSICKLDQKSRLLDIGCATGRFLRDCREKFGCDVYGVEIDKDAADYARDHNGINIYNGDFLNNNFPSDYFDCITTWWFLEHTHSPRRVMEEINRLLKRGGFVIHGIPNGRSVGRYLFQDKWYGYDTPRHLYVFSPATIGRLLQETRFRVIAIKHDYSTWDLMGSLQYFLFGEKYLPGKRIGNVQTNRKANLLMRPLGLIQGILKLSGTIVVYAQKNQSKGGSIDTSI